MSEQNPKVDWGDPPGESDRVPYRKIRRPKPGAKVYGVVLSESVCGVWVHYNGSHDVPHYTPREKCEQCSQGYRNVRWKGYVECLDPLGGGRFLAELTEEAVRQLTLSHLSPPKWRGSVITLTRAGNRNNSRVVAELVSGATTYDLPPPIAIRPCLWRIWFGRKNPIPQQELGT